MKDNWILVVEMISYFKCDLLLHYDARDGMTVAQVLKNDKVMVSARAAGGSESNLANKIIHELFKKALQ